VIYAFESDVLHCDVTENPGMANATVRSSRSGVWSDVPNAPAACGIISEKFAVIFVPADWVRPSRGQIWNPSPIVTAVTVGVGPVTPTFSLKKLLPEKLFPPFAGALPVALVELAVDDSEVVRDSLKSPVTAELEKLRAIAATSPVVLTTTWSTPGAKNILECVIVVRTVPLAFVLVNELENELVTVASVNELTVNEFVAVVVRVKVNWVVRLVVWLIVTVRVTEYGNSADSEAGPAKAYVDVLVVCVVDVVDTELNEVIVCETVLRAVVAFESVMEDPSMSACVEMPAVTVTITSGAVPPVPTSVMVVFVNETPLSLIIDSPGPVTIHGQSLLSAS